METFIWETFTKKIAIKATMAELYAAWTIPSKIESWFLSKANYKRINGNYIDKNESIQVHDSYEWSWYLYDVVEKGTITHVNGLDHIQFTFAGNCLVDVRLTKRNDEVIVELTQSNIPTDDKSKKNIRIGCATGWSFFLLNLKSVYEGGIDLRNKNEALKGMVNN